jgi:alpha-tubulin suppressor-like RCC1 family protein
MRTTDRKTTWILPALLILIVLGMTGLSWGATPKVAAGENHSALLKADGTLWTAGLNLAGQLGDGSQISRNQAVQVGLDNRWQTVATGAEHTLALKADGTLWAWGSNASGQLGVLANGNPVASQSAPLQVGSARDWVAVAAAGFSSYALKADGTLWAWGEGSLGQLGNGLSIRQNQPVAVSNPNPFGRWLAISAGSDHVLALQADGSLWSWGSNASGQLGQGAQPADPSTPAQILTGLFTDNDWSAVAAGGGHSLALKADGTLWSWGDNASGQLGIGSLVSQNLPVPVGSDHDWSGLAAGALHSLALKKNGSLYSWGDNSSGQLGNGQLAQQNSPAPALAASGASGLLALSAGAFHSLALKANGEIYSWGGNLDGQLANGSQTGALVAVLAGNAGPGWKAQEPGNQFSLALRSNGTLWAWGDNASGQLGNGTLNPAAAPVRVDTQSNWSALSAGFAHVAALKADGTLWTWGDNSSGQLGDNSLDPSSFPLQLLDTKPVSPLNDWAAVSAGDFHTLALKADGTLWSWGDNSSGQLGDNTNTPAGKQPNQVVTGFPGSFDNNWVAIAAVGTPSLGLQADGTLWAWGDNSLGQLGDPTIVGSVNVPTQIINFTPPAQNLGFNGNWKQIAAGFGHTVALQADGTVWAWGSNFDGQLGNGDATQPNPANQPAPVQVLNPGGVPYVAVAAGDAHTTVRQADGTLWSFGRNLDGQLGIGLTDVSAVPHPTPLQEAGAASTWSASATGGSHSVALKSDGTLWSWGSNFSGQLGDGSAVDRNQPAPLREGFAGVPASLTLPTGFIGGAATNQNLAIGNLGNGDLFVSGFSLGGADAAQFSVAPGTCSGLAFVLPAGGSCNLRVSFQAAAPSGSKSAQLTVLSSDPVLPQRQVALSAQTAQHVVTLAPGANGSIFGPLLVDENATPSYSIVAATTFHVVNVTVNGVSRGAISTLTLAPVTADVTIAASFAIDTFAVSFLSGGNGTLSGAVSQTVAFGSPATTVTAVPALGYHFVNWTEGAAIVSTNPALTLGSITAARTLTANFAINTFAVNFTAGANGTLSGPASQTVNFAASAAQVSALPNTGYHFVNWTEGGTPFSTSAALTLSNVTAAHTLTANFAINVYPVTFAAAGNGTLTGTTSQNVNHGSAASTVTAVPAAGNHFVNWTEAGQVVSVSAALSVPSVTTAHNFVANFAPNSFVVSYFSGGNGSLTGAASQNVLPGADASTVIAVPALGFHFVSWTEGGGVLSTNPVLTITNVVAIRNVTANFAIDTFTVLASSDARGSISQAGATQVAYGSSITYSFLPNAGYQVVDVLVDGVSLGAPSSFTFANVTANGHSIKAVFIPDGDVNSDGQVTIADALLALQIAVGLNQATPAQLRHGDLAPLDAGGIPTPDTQIQVADALVILRKSVGLTSGF